MNKLLKILGLLLIVFFLSLYFSKYTNNYYDNKSNLTEEAIKRYEKDLKEGKDINPSNYVVEEKNYNNKASIMGLKVSKLIENTFSKGLNYILNHLEKYE